MLIGTTRRVVFARTGCTDCGGTGRALQVDTSAGVRAWAAVCRCTTVIIYERSVSPRVLRFPTPFPDEVPDEQVAFRSTENDEGANPL